MKIVKLLCGNSWITFCILPTKQNKTKNKQTNTHIQSKQDYNSHNIRTLGTDTSSEKVNIPARKVNW